MPLIRKGAAPPAAPDRPGDAEDGLRAGASDERWAAARALAGRPEAAPALGAALLAEEDARVREAILTALARIGTPESAGFIAPLVRSDDAERRTAALDALRAMPQVLETEMTRLLDDPEADVRLLACDLARDMEAPVATAMLCGLLAREPEANVCAAAVDVLAECGGPEALPALAECAKRFADVPFLVFATRVAGDRIRAQTSARDG